MGSIEVGQRVVEFQKCTRICGNCEHEKRVRDEMKDRTERSCKLNGWFVLMSSTCKKHEFKKGGRNATAQR